MGKRSIQGKGKTGLFEPVINWLRKDLKKHHGGSGGGHHRAGGHSSLGTRRRRSDPRNYPAAPRRTPDSYLPGGDPVYHGQHSTAIGHDSATMINFDNVQPLAGHHDVVVHGTPEGYFLPGRVDASGTGFSGNATHSNHIADAVTGNPNYRGEPVRLVSCHSGATAVNGETSAAQAVANRLGVPVQAPTNAVGVKTHGGPGQTPTIRQPGNWVTFYPR